MKNILKHLLGFLLGMLLAPLYAAGVSAWIWAPIMFGTLNFFGDFWFGLIIGLFVSSGTAFIYHKLTN